MNSSSNPQPHYASMVYDFNIDGWVAGFISSYENSIIPRDAIITNVYMQVFESLAGATDGIALFKIGGVVLLIDVYSDLPAGNTIYTDFSHHKSQGTPATIQFAGTVPLTQGKFNIIVEYFMSGE